MLRLQCVRAAKSIHVNGLYAEVVLETLESLSITDRDCDVYSRIQLYGASATQRLIG